MNKIGRERGWQPATRQQLEAGKTLRGADFVGTPDQIIEKILFQHEIFGHQRLLLQLGIGAVEHAKMMRAVELLGTQVAPVVRQAIAQRQTMPA
jgi:alkanesulfonate monooxygenase SsuD/methylene tetrahydromethanopterin reductase-like flavin-dependent oxidoreductase (luciferase family)